MPRSVHVDIDGSGLESARSAQMVLLTQEVHHRVKNSLQLVHSLLNTQANETKHEGAASQLRESAARVRVIGALHDRLYRTGGTLEVEIEPYLSGLIEDLRTGMASGIAGRQIILNAEHALWTAADIPALGLVLTELVTNALKYGAGTITISFRQEASRQALLIVEDDGKLPQNFNVARSAGFGMRLIQTLVAKRDGFLMIDSSVDHTRFIAVMPRAIDEI
jgi:two-component sensor histidine kinase